MSKAYGIEEARKILGDLVTAAQYGRTTTLTRNGRPAARIVPIKESAMTPRTNTSYGTWNNRCEPYSANLATTVVEALGDYGDDYDVDALTADYRDAINAALPESVTLAGDEFIGPHRPDADEWDGYPTDEHGQLDIKAIVDGVDFWEIAQKHDKNA